MIRYLIRLDDACPAMKRDHWDRMEEALIELDIQPIVGVIPDNRDASLDFDPPDPKFWDRVRGWQDLGWKIALHGVHHDLHPIPAGADNLIPLNDRTEFAGVPLRRQTETLRHGVKILESKGISPTIWMAPAHSMDRSTLRALRETTSIRVITDGLARYPWTEDGFTWLPQQRWTLPATGSGVWTICTHPSTLTRPELDTLIAGIRRHEAHFCRDIDSLQDEFADRPRSLADRIWARAFLTSRRIRPVVSRLAGRTR